MRVAGLISGTSHDGIDVAVVDFRLEGSALTGHVLHTDGVPYDPALRARLVAALPPAPTTLAEVARLDTEIGQAFAAVAADAAAAVGGVDAACSHGQTVFHWVEGTAALGTLQIGQPAWIAEGLGVPVVADVRARDIAAGGQGAPLVALLDRLLLRGRGRAGALNLGGIANLTVVDGDDVTAFDVGPANALVDAVVAARGLHPLGFDEDGRLARAGVVDEELLAALLGDPYYRLAPPKTTGKEHFHHAYVQERLAARRRPVADADLVATLTALTVRTVADAVREARLDRLVISGGGCRNPVVVDGLRAALPGVELVRSDALGAPADAKEAILLALLGWCTLHGVPGVVPGTTGASAARVLGTIVPGSAPLVLPQPVVRVDSLRLRAAVSGS